MQKVIINLNEVGKVKSFVNIIQKFPCDCDITSSSRRYVIDAKSIMGIFSLNLSEPLTLIIYNDGPLADEIIAEIKEFIA